MAVRKVKIGDLPKRVRHAELPAVMQTADWRVAEKQLIGGLKPHEAIVIVLEPAEMKRRGIANVRAAGRPIKKFVQKYRPTYTVTAMNTSEGATIIIANKAVLAQRA